MADPKPTPESSIQRTADGRVFVRAQDGSLQSVPEADALTYVREGRGTLATADDIAERAKQKQFGEGIGTEVRTALEAGADVATLGAYSAGARVLGGEDAAQGIRERRARNPLATTTGELAAIGTLALAGGVPALEGAATLTPAGAAMRAGLATERALAGSTALSRIGSITAAGAVEGGLFGLGKGVQDIALSERDADRKAEAMLAHLGRSGGEGLLFGAVAGFGAGSLAVGSSALARRARELFKRSQADDAARAGTVTTTTAESGARSGAGSAAGADAQSGAASVAGADARSGAASAADAEAGFASRMSGQVDNSSQAAVELRIKEDRTPMKLLADRASARKRLAVQREGFVTATTQDLSDIADGTDELMMQVRRFKPDQVKRALADLPIENIDATIAETSGLMAKVKTQTDALMATPLGRDALRSSGGAGYLKYVADAGNGVFEALTKQSPDELFGTLNQYKSIVGKAAKRTQEPNARAMLDAHYHELQGLLENETLWGGMARLNKGINPGWTRALSASEVEDQLVSAAPKRSSADPFRQGVQGDSAKVGSVFDSLGSADGATRVGNAREYLESRREFARLARETFELSPAQLAKARAIEEKTTRALKRLDDSTRTAIDLRDFQELGGSLNEINGAREIVATIKAGVSGAVNLGQEVAAKAGVRTGAEAATAAGSQAGAGAATKVGTNAGAASEAGADAAVRVARLEQFSRASGSVLASLGAAARGVVRGSGTAVRSALPPAAVSAAKSREQAFERAWTATVAWETDPFAATRRAWKAQGDVARYAPQIAEAQAVRIAALGQLLSDKLPRHEAPSLYGEDQGKPPRVTPAEREEFLKYWRAANDPMSVVEDAANGKLSTEGVEVLRTGYPQLYDGLRLSVLDELQKGEKPSWKQRLLLGQMLELPTDLALEADLLATLQSSAASAEADAAATVTPRGAPDTSAARTGSEALASRTR